MDGTVVESQVQEMTNMAKQATVSVVRDISADEFTSACDEIESAARDASADDADDEEAHCEHGHMTDDTCDDCGESCSTNDAVCNDTECPIHGAV